MKISLPLVIHLFICFFEVNGVFGSAKCSPREYGKGNIVCVCNALHCDLLEPPQIKPRVVTVIESSKKGKRFETSTAVFQKTSKFEKHKLFERYVDITINRNEKYQKIIGFGGAFTDAATINIRSLPETLSKRIVADYYSKNGLQYNIGRIPIAGCDFSTRKYTYDDVKDDFNLTNFKLTEEDLSFKIPVIKEAMAVSSEQIYLFGSAWSSPAWMKTSNKLEGRGFLKGSPGGKYYKTWANYYVKFLDEYQSNGVQLWGMTTGNEPLMGHIPNFRWNALGFTPSTQRDFVKLDLGPALENAGYPTNKFNVMIHDDQLPFLPSFADAVFGDKTASKYVVGAGFHWYMNYFNAYDTLDKVHSKFPNKFLLPTEACTGSVPLSKHVSLGDWDRGVSYAKDIIQDLNHWASGWVDWNLALDETGGPNWAKNFVDAPIIVNKTAAEYYKNPMFYVMGHFSKFISRSSVRLGFSEKKSAFNPTISTVFETPKNETVLVVVNPSDKTTKFSVFDPNRGVLKLILNRNSITTLIWI